MPAAVNRIGEVHGKLTIVAKANKSPKSHWVCLCECGNEAVASNSNIVSGNTRSCGCEWVLSVKKEMIGLRFGSLTVISPGSGKKFNSSVFATYNCLCDCGGTIETLGMSLRNSDTVSCGCAYKVAGALRIKPPAHHKAMSQFNNKRRRAARLSAHRPFDPEFFDLFEVEAYALCRLRFEATGIRHEVDHLVPLRSKLVCGLHNEFNLGVISAAENNRKGNRFWPQMPTMDDTQCSK